MFTCIKCGFCCRNIGSIPELAEFHTGDGICIYLSDDNLCDIYAIRPDICNVEKMYELTYKAIMSKSEYERRNMEGCKLLRSKNKEFFYGKI